MNETVRSPPKKKQIFVRVLEKITPKFLHEYYTPQFIAGWNISNYVTWAQAYVVFKWDVLSAFFMAKVWPIAIPLLTKAGDVLSHLGLVIKGAATDVLSVLWHTS